jgi:hypothetical protein
MTRVDTDRLIRQFIGGDPILLVAAALIDPAAPGLLERANASAATTSDRQLVAIAAAHIARDADRVDALARDHLVDHPDNILVAWIAGAAKAALRAPDNRHPHDGPKESHQHGLTPLNYPIPDESILIRSRSARCHGNRPGIVTLALMRLADPIIRQG